MEVGEGRLLVFPPVNAPQAVKDAWAQATEGLSEQDIAIAQLFSQLRGALEFSVAREGWTDTNSMFRELYDRFEGELA